MASGPQGPVNGEEVGAAVRRAAAARALDSVLPATGGKESTWPRLEMFSARELPRLHSLQLPTYELVWLMRPSELSREGYVVGLTFKGRDSVRGMAAALRVCADRLDQIAGAVERGEPVPPPPGAGGQAVDNPANAADGAGAQAANPANDDTSAGGGKLG